MHALLRIHGLRVSYSRESEHEIRALDCLDLEVRAGEVVGLLGESGCGKSTLASAIMGLLLPPQARVENGTIHFGDQNLLILREAELRQFRGRQISLISQDPALSLNPVLTVGTQVDEVLRAHLFLTPREIRERVLALLAEVGFDQPDLIYNAYPHQLSGGQRQRVVIAQAVSCHPALMIADEATSKLDAVLRSDVTDLLLRIRASYGTALLVISHDPTFLVTIADRIAVMYAGKILEAESCSNIFNRPRHPYTKELTRIATSVVLGGGTPKARFPIASDSARIRECGSQPTQEG